MVKCSLLDSLTLAHSGFNLFQVVKSLRINTIGYNFVKAFNNIQYFLATDLNLQSSRSTFIRVACTDVLGTCILLGTTSYFQYK